MNGLQGCLCRHAPSEVEECRVVITVQDAAESVVYTRPARDRDRPVLTQTTVNIRFASEKKYDDCSEPDVMR